MLKPIKEYRQSKATRKIWACFLLSIFLAYTGATSLFYHTHIVDGKQITHSHPFTDNNNVRHSHTSTDFANIALLSIILMLAVYFRFDFNIFVSKILKQQEKSYRTCNSVTSLTYLRAPPQFSVL